MSAVIIGAGVIGVTTAYHLGREGCLVTVIDRQPGPALETSYANGGQISANHATPWAGPSTPWKALKWLGQIDAPLLLHLRFDRALLVWLARFLSNCRPSRVPVNIERALRLALYSRVQLAALRADTGITYDHLCRGILHIFRNPRDYADSLPATELMNRLGCARRLVSAEECVAIEPALTAVRDRLVGGSFSPDDESGDAHLFSQRLAAIAEGFGVRFRWGETVAGLRTDGRRIAAVETGRGERIAADAVILAAGSYAPLLAKPLGLKLPVYPAKGYSVTIPVEKADATPVVSLIDDEFKMVYSRLGERLRVAGTAEFIGFDASVTEARARFLLGKAMQLFPGCGDPTRAEFWAGLRPSTPDGVPLVGPAPGFDNLYLNTGHGTLGWTMAAGSGRVVADLVLGRQPEISLDGLGLERFR